jgi:methylenetetrahydrofolate dehydrogenase (NADP+) / methenyltetrahydrofolate cyclohydrolase
MKIDGTTIAAHIYSNLKPRIEALTKRNIIPHVAVILVGNDHASEAYVSQKKKRAEENGIHVSLFHYDANIDTKILLAKVYTLNADESIHGIIIQRPLPSHINTQQITEQTNPQKDVDSFHIAAPFDPPLPAAVITILETIFAQHVDHSETFHLWLMKRHIVILGKGETAGAPIINYLKGIGCNPQVIDSKTKNKDSMLKQADIVISAVGQDGIITAETLKPGVILIGIGLHRNETGHLAGDYDESEVEKLWLFIHQTQAVLAPSMLPCC